MKATLLGKRLTKNRRDRVQPQSSDSGTSRQTTLVPESLSISDQDPTPLTPAVFLNLQDDAPSDPPSAFEVGKGKWIPKSSGTLSSSPDKLSSSPGKYSSSPPTLAQMQYGVAQPDKMSSSPTSASPLNHRQQASYDFPSPDVLLRRDSRLSMYAPVPETTMDNLQGVTM